MKKSTISDFINEHEELFRKAYRIVVISEDDETNEYYYNVSDFRNNSEFYNYIFDYKVEIRIELSSPNTLDYNIIFFLYD